MGCENLAIARTDAESGKLLSSAIDFRDHEFILGIPEAEVTPLAETLQTMESKGAPGNDIDAYEAEWIEAHELCTFDEGEWCTAAVKTE